MYQLSGAFHRFCQRRQSNNAVDDTISDIVEILNADKVDLSELSNCLHKHKIGRIENLKPQLLQFLLNYADYIISDREITDDELRDFTILKRIFKIKEGDFMNHCSSEVQYIVRNEFVRIYADNVVDVQEQRLSLNLQDLFDLSYDRFENLKKDEVIQALQRGARPEDLDIAKIP